ncbi:MAG: hypothetical protein RL370_908, partial [Actinomycetota bacterium]
VLDERIDYNRRWTFAGHKTLTKVEYLPMTNWNAND